MSAERRCAAPGCDNIVARRHRRGRPPIYCSSECRPSGRSATPINVEVDQVDDEGHGSRSWVVRLSRGGRSVELGQGLGRFSAVVLATEVRQLLGEAPKEGGSAID
jgi:hypothetical protein